MWCSENAGPLDGIDEYILVKLHRASMQGIRSLDSTVMLTVLPTLNYKDIAHFTESFKGALAVIPEYHEWKRLRVLYMDTESFARKNRSPNFLVEMALAAARREKYSLMDVLRTIIPTGPKRYEELSTYRDGLNMAIMAILYYKGISPAHEFPQLNIATSETPEQHITEALTIYCECNPCTDGWECSNYRAQCILYLCIDMLAVYSLIGDDRLFQLVYEYLDDRIMSSTASMSAMLSVFGTLEGGIIVGAIHDIFVKYSKVGRTMADIIALPGQWDRIEWFTSALAKGSHDPEGRYMYS